MAGVNEIEKDDVVDTVTCQQCLEPQDPLAMTSHRGHRMCVACKQAVLAAESRNALRRRTAQPPSLRTALRA
jgi:hypothetical protein